MGDLGSFFLGASSSIMVCLLSSMYIDEVPHEHMYIEACKSIDSDLSSYDSMTITCESGASFKVKSLRENTDERS